MMRKSDVLFILALTLSVATAVVHADPEPAGRLIARGRGSTGFCYNVRVEGQTAYVVNNPGLVIFDVSDPDRPKKIGAVKGLSPSFAVDLVGHFAYIGGEGGLAVVDVADPKSPRVIGRFFKGETINVLKTGREYAFMITSGNFLKILSVQNPESPQEIGQFNDGGRYYYHALGISDDVIYLGDLEHGLELIDVSNPRSPRKILTVSGTEGGGAVFVARDILALSFPRKAPAVYSISDPRSPRRFENAFDEDEILSVMGLSSDYLVGKADGERVTVFKISDPLSFTPIASRGLARKTAMHVAFLRDNFIYFTGKDMNVFEIQEDDAPSAFDKKHREPQSCPVLSTGNRLASWTRFFAPVFW